MRTLFKLLLYLLISSCGGNDSSKTGPVVLRHNIKDTVTLPTVDSLSLLDSIYKGKRILASQNIDSFSCTDNYDYNSKIIKIRCAVAVAKHSVAYLLELSDTSNKYEKASFYPSDDYQYHASYILVDNYRLPVFKLRYFNDTSKVDPVNVWYGNGFGPVLKYYSLSDKEVFLIRGINFYCNGNSCTNYKVFVIELYRNKRTPSIWCIDYPGNYPFNFENTFLFKDSSDRLGLYYIVAGKMGTRTEDYRIITL